MPRFGTPQPYAVPQTRRTAGTQQRSAVPRPHPAKTGLLRHVSGPQFTRSKSTLLPMRALFDRFVTH
jgi:hypothetical protein